LISNSNFKIQFEFEKVFNMKVVELEIMKISYFGNFSSCHMILRVIWQKQLNLENWGRECYSCRQIRAEHRAAWAPASRRGLRPASRRARDHQLLLRDGRAVARVVLALLGSDYKA
jgi:hypothetical protein